MFLKISAIENGIFFGNEVGGKVSFVKIFFSSDLLGVSIYLKY